MKMKFINNTYFAKCQQLGHNRILSLCYYEPYFNAFSIDDIVIRAGIRNAARVKKPHNIVLKLNDH